AIPRWGGPLACPGRVLPPVRRGLGDRHLVRSPRPPARLTGGSGGLAYGSCQVSRPGRNRSASFGAQLPLGEGGMGGTGPPHPAVLRARAEKFGGRCPAAKTPTGR